MRLSIQKYVSGLGVRILTINTFACFFDGIVALETLLVEAETTVMGSLRCQNLIYGRSYLHFT